MVRRHSRRAGSTLEPLLEGREWCRGPPSGMKVVVRHSRRFGRHSRRFERHSRRVATQSQRAGSGQEALPVTSGHPPEGPVVVVGPLGGPGGVMRPTWRICKPSRRARGVRRPSQKARKGQEALLEGREGLGGPPGWSSGVWRPSHRAGRGQESFPDDRVRSGSHLRGLGGVGRPFRMAGMSRKPLSEGQEVLGGPPKGREALGGPPKGREALGGHPGGPGGVRGTLLVGRCQEALPVGWDGWGGLSGGQEGLGGTPGGQ